MLAGVTSGYGKGVTSSADQDQVLNIELTIPDQNVLNLVVAHEENMKQAVSIRSYPRVSGRSCFFPELLSKVTSML